jgi:hypothetical protein
MDRRYTGVPPFGIAGQVKIMVDALTLLVSIAKWHNDALLGVDWLPMLLMASELIILGQHPGQPVSALTILSSPI